MQAFNPFLPSWEYIPDGEPRVFAGRLYIYGSHDRFDGEHYCMNDYVCWSAPVGDLSDWRYDGVIYKKEQEPLFNGGQLFAPDCVKGNDGRYYLYYCLSSLPVTSVAVSDSPSGAFEFYGHVKYGDGRVVGQQRGDVRQFDPGVLVDGDGKAYMYTCIAPPPGEWRDKDEAGGLLHGGAYCYELAADMLTVVRGPFLVAPRVGDAAGTGFEGHEFFEASSIRKRNNIYYFVYSSINGHELCYATSGDPTSGFRFGGTLVSNGDVFPSGGEPMNYMGNTHGGLVGINGQFGDWYVFYHRQTNRHQYSRQACAERVTFAEDGSIAQAETTSCGLNGKPLAGRGVYPAYIACNLRGKNGAYHYSPKPNSKNDVGADPYFTQDEDDHEGDSGFGQYIANMRDGALAGFKYFDFTAPPVTVTIMTRGSAAGIVRVTTTAFGGESVCGIIVSPSDSWADFTAPVSVEPNGKTALFLTFSGEGALDLLSVELR